jgi:hypothetical protein
MLNFKQEELIRQLVKDIRATFPEVNFINVTPSPENPDELWIRVTAPADEEKEFELREFSANRTMDILLDYGYHMLVMPTHNPNDASFWPHIDVSIEES